MSKTFSLAAAAAQGDVDEKLPFTIDGDDTQLYAYPLTEGEMVAILGVAGDFSAADAMAMGRAGAEVLNVFWELMDEETAIHLRKRLRDRHDPFGLGDIMNIIEWLVEESSARPTPLPSVSTPSPPNTGLTSTGGAQRRASTRSPSPPTGSAISSTRGRSNTPRNLTSSMPS